MAKKIKFALEMANGEQVRNIDAFKEHFDIERVIGYYLNGRLLTWLRDRYYEDEAQKVTELSKDDSKLHNKLCAIFGVETEDEELNTEEIGWRTEHLNKLKQYTDDREILAKVDQVAFDQEELSDLLDEGVNDIYLCANRFTIPLKVTDKTYIGVGKAVAVIRSDKVIDFDELQITFKNIKFDDKYESVLSQKMIAEQKSFEKENNSELPEKLFNEAEEAYYLREFNTDYKIVLDKYKQSAELGYSRAYGRIILIYLNGVNDIEKDLEEARRWAKLGMDNNDDASFGYNALLLMENDNVTKSDKKEAFNLLKKAVVNIADSFLWYKLGEMYRDGIGTFYNDHRANQCFYVARVLADFQNSRWTLEVANPKNVR